MTTLQQRRTYTVYLLECLTSGQIYIGITTNTLQQRLKIHIWHFNLYLKGKSSYVTSFEILKNNNYKISALTTASNKLSALKKEGYYIQFYVNTVNKIVSGRTPKEFAKEYYLQNKEKFKEKSKRYRQKNQEKIKEYNKEYRQKNQEYYKEYYLQNQEKFKEYYLKNQEYYKEKSKEYRQKNQEKLKEYKKEYYLQKKRIREIFGDFEK